MCVCMDGPARVSVMYLYMILHTYINLDILGRCEKRPQNVTFFFAASAMTYNAKDSPVR